MNTTNAVNTQAKPPAVKMAVKFDQGLLETKQQEARDAILNGKYTYYKASGHGAWSYPAQDTFSFTGFDLIVDFIAEMITKGRVLSHTERPWNQGYHYQVSFLKSKEDLEILFAESDEKVKAEYEQEIADHNQAQIDLLTQQLYQQSKAKEEKAISDKEAKALAAAKLEAEKFIQSQLKEGK
jgi:hypothetical protein